VGENIQCRSCSIVIGPGQYANGTPFMAGDEPLCGYCRGIMKRQGFIQLNMSERLLPDGSIIRFRVKTSDLVEA